MKRIISHISQMTGLAALVKARLDKGHHVAITISRADAKTIKQLGYLHTTVLPLLTEALFDAGEIKARSESAAKLWLKMQINYGAFYEIGKSVIFDPKSFAAAKIDDLIKAIDEAILQAQERGVWIPPPKGSK